MENGIEQLGDLETTQIKKYGGFYIGRYEAGVSVLDRTTNTFIDSVTFGENSLNGNVTASRDSHGWNWQNADYYARSNSMTSLLGSTYGVNKASGSVVVKADAIPYYHSDYYTAKEMSKRLYTNKGSVESGLVTGTQWDMMIKCMQDNGVAITGENCNWGNYDDVAIDGITGYYTEVDISAGSTNGFKEGSTFTTNGGTSSYTLLTTGASEKVKKMNLYDVAGNLWEWTDESAYISSTDAKIYSTTDYNTFMVRGGSLKDAHAAITACFRVGTYVLNSGTNLGFRVALYIK